MSNKNRARQAVAARHTRNRWLIWGGLAVVVVAAIVIAVVASSGGDSTSSSSSAKGTSETAPVTVDGTDLPQFTGKGTDAAVGKTIPTLTGVSFDGTPVEITATGKPQMIAFVAHWCPHCQREVPVIVSMADSGAFDGIDVTAVATGTNSGYPNYPPSAWLQSVKWPFPVLADSSKFTAANAWGLPSYPYLVFVDKDGKVVGRTSGEIAPADLRKILTALKAGETLPIGSAGASSGA